MKRRELISGIKNNIKEVNADSRLSNRLIWFNFQSAAKLIMRQEADKKKLWASLKFESICIEMEEVSTNVCDCVYLPSDCTIYRSKYKIPEISEYSLGPIIQGVYSIDLSKKLFKSTPTTYQTKKSIRNNTTLYYFIYNGYLYSPNFSSKRLMVSALFDTSTVGLKCGELNSEASAVKCSIMDDDIGYPDYVIDIAKTMTEQKLLQTYKAIIEDTLNNKNPNIEAK